MRLFREREQHRVPGGGDPAPRSLSEQRGAEVPREPDPLDGLGRGRLGGRVEIGQGRERGRIHIGRIAADDPLQLLDAAQPDIDFDVDGADLALLDAHLLLQLLAPGPAFLLLPLDLLHLAFGLEAVDRVALLADELALGQDRLDLRGQVRVLDLLPEVALEEELAGPAVDDFQLLARALDPPLEVPDALLGSVDGLEALELLAVVFHLRLPPGVVVEDRVGRRFAVAQGTEELPERPLGVPPEIGVGDLGSGMLVAAGLRPVQTVDLAADHDFLGLELDLIEEAFGLLLLLEMLELPVALVEVLLDPGQLLEQGPVGVPVGELPEEGEGARPELHEAGLALAEDLVPAADGVVAVVLEGGQALDEAADPRSEES